jgi:hypothetical protein
MLWITVMSTSCFSSAATMSFCTDLNRENWSFRLCSSAQWLLFAHCSNSLLRARSAAVRASSSCNCSRFWYFIHGYTFQVAFDNRNSAYLILYVLEMEEKRIAFANFSTASISFVEGVNLRIRLTATWWSTGSITATTYMGPIPLLLIEGVVWRWTVIHCWNTSH